MSTFPLPRSDGGARFPGFDAASQVKHWDTATASVVMARLGRPQDIRFFTPAQEAAAGALFNQLLDQHREPRVPVVSIVDARLAAQQTDGWHYEDMPTDAQAWARTLAALDEDAGLRCGTLFATASLNEQARLLQSIQNLGKDMWHGMPAQQVWSLWTRYACTAFYSHPWAWNEIGFAGPAYPRGYKNMGVDALEPFEVPDANPGDDPIRTKAEPS
ncbi:gluconate 2-dehydrogenase subunit 3 family protein [Arthrobacter sp. GMC3]|uniref:gluconate 2-dehydrogenase subunit 3 family protein n=1 Tax=Arthrobacter sp. GMC3 TaxID=2058894 RepID=UPI000CE3A6BF|nr:gluconate 2-dehydrogenase subunit 3 family protein [Arthrobacter sp. GMC3]